jgi:hypothetical protein
MKTENYNNIVNYSDVFLFSINNLQPQQLYQDDNQIDYINEDSYDITSYKFGNKSLLFYNTHTYIRNIYDSFNKNSENIWKLTSLDLPRMPTFINHTLINNNESFKKHTDKYIDYYDSTTLDLDLQTLLAMLSTQSAFGFPFILLYNVYNTGQNKQDNTNLHLLSTNEGRKIDIVIDQDDININLNSIYNIMDTNTQHIVSKIKTTLDLNIIIDNDNKTYTYNNGIINWTKLS